MSDPTPPCGPECPDCRDDRFLKELTSLLNRHSRENDSGTPDFILADYLISCLNAFAMATNSRERWYGRKTGVLATRDPASPGDPKGPGES